MSNIIFWNIILLEIALGLCFYMWFVELLTIYYTISIYLNIAFVCTIWLMHFGSKYYQITYRKPNDEPGVYRIIEFPSVWW